MGDLHRKVKTVMLILIWTTMGLYIELGGPTLLDLKIYFDADYELVARAISAQGVGLFLGAAVAGLIVDALGVWKDVIITACQVTVVLAVTSMPYVPNITVLWCLFFVNGAAGGAVNVAGQRILLEMWEEKSASPMHALHMGFGIGALVTPLITNHFLAVLRFGDSPGDFQSLNITANMSHGVAENGIPFVIVEETRVQYAFVTVGVICAILSIPFFMYPFYIFRSQSDSDVLHGKEEKQPLCSKLANIFQPSTYTDGSLKFGIQVLIITFIFYFTCVGTEQLYGNFVRTFSVDQLNFRREEASYLDTAYWGSFTLGRLTGALASHFTPIRILFVIDVLLYLISATLLNIFSTNSHILLWIFTILVGFTVAPLFPAYMSLLNNYMEVGGMVLTFIMIATGSGFFFYIWLTGFLYNEYGPKTLLYALQGSSILLVILCAAVVTLTYRRKNRFQKNLGDALYTSGSLQEMSYSRLNDEED